jgi:hypothetical protein
MFQDRSLHSLAGGRTARYARWQEAGRSLAGGRTLATLAGRRQDRSLRSLAGGRTLAALAGRRQDLIYMAVP